MSTKRDTVLNVAGMTCPSCTRHVTKALQDLDGVGNVQVELRAGTVRVEHDPAAAPVENLIDALRDAGYESRPRPV
jgi:copper chaperone